MAGLDDAIEHMYDNAADNPTAKWVTAEEEINEIAADHAHLELELNKDSSSSDNDNNNNNRQDTCDQVVNSGSGLRNRSHRTANLPARYQVGV